MWVAEDRWAGSGWVDGEGKNERKEESVAQRNEERSKKMKENVEMSKKQE